MMVITMTQEMLLTVLVEWQPRRVDSTNLRTWIAKEMRREILASKKKCLAWRLISLSSLP